MLARGRGTSARITGTLPGGSVTGLIGWEVGSYLRSTGEAQFFLSQTVGLTNAVTVTYGGFALVERVQYIAIMRKGGERCCKVATRGLTSAAT